MKKTNWQHQKHAIRTNQGSLPEDDRATEHEKQKLHADAKSERETRQALKKKHSTDQSENS